MFEKLRIKLKEREYKRYIEKHRSYVKDAFVEMVMCPDLNWIMLEPDVYDALLDRIEKHDLSKYSKEEFDGYRKFFYPINKKEKEENKKEFDKAWEHHWKNNDHHWQNRQEDTDCFFDNKIAILENVCDWLAMGYQFNDRPYQYYEKHKDEIKLNEKDKKFLEQIIYEGIDKECIERQQNLSKERWRKYGRI